MKIKSISALLAALGCSVSLGATTTITDFSGLLGGTSQDGISLIGINATATGTGGLSLNNGSLDFTMTGATNRPNISANQSFSVALTFDLSTLNAATDSTLFFRPIWNWCLRRPFRSPVQGRGSSFRLLGYQPNQREIRDNRSHRLRNRKYRQSVCCMDKNL